MRFRQLLPLFGALFALYIIWGSTYFVIRIGVESWPPLMMAGVRFLSAGMLLMAFLLLRGVSFRREARHAAWFIGVYGRRLPGVVRFYYRH